MSESKNKIIPGELKTVQAQLEATLSFEKRLEKWLSSLTAEERLVALSFEDSDFVSIMFHLARNSGLPSSQKPYPADYSNDGKTETCGGECLESVFWFISCFWRFETCFCFCIGISIFFMFIFIHPFVSIMLVPKLSNYLC